jgi:hypothetical protein
MLLAIFYTNKFIPTRFAGITYGPVVFIRPEYKSDAGLLAHELTHVAQFWKQFITFGFLYLFSRTHRLGYEVEAYQEQLKHSPGNEKLYAQMLSTMFDLRVSFDQALFLIRNQQPL